MSSFFSSIKTRIDAIYAALIASGGAALIGRGASTIAADLTTYETDLLTGASPRIMSRTGSAGEPNTIINGPAINKIASYATACHLQGGTTGLPNMIGWEYDFKRVQGTGTDTYVMTFAFVVNSTPASPRITTLRRSDNVYVPATGPVTVTGYGTDTLTITLGAALASTHDLFVQVDGSVEMSALDPDSNPRLSNIMNGYNNRSNQLMNVVNGAHCRAVGSDGHNTILGGSNNLILGGAYCTIGGTNVIAAENDPGGTGVVAIGQNLVADGTGSVNFGFSNTTLGNYTVAIGGSNKATLGSAVAIGYGNISSGAGSVAIGYTNTASASYAVAMGLSCVAGASYTTVFGRENTASAGSYTLLAGYKNESALSAGFACGFYGKVRNTAQMVQGLGGAVAGSRQASKAYVSGQSTSATAVTLTKTGGSTIVCDIDSAVSITGRIVGRDKNNLESCVFDVDALIMVNGASAVTIVGGGTNTLKFNSAGLAGVTSTLVVGTAGVTVRVVGLADKTINWVAVLDLVEISITAQ